MSGRRGVAVVTGGSRGIGEATAMALARDGYDVAVMARGAEALERVAERVRALGRRAVALVADATDDAAVVDALARCRAELGPLDALVCNHGIYHRDPSPEGDLSAWARVIDINLRSTMAVTRRALDDITRDGDCSGRAIVFVASIAGKSSYAGGAAYCASKHGVVGFAHAVFEDLRNRGIKVSVVLPGYVNTQMLADAVTDGKLDPERTLQPEDVAEAVRWVAASSSTACPVEIILRPQRSPYL